MDFCSAFLTSDKDLRIVLDNYFDGIDKTLDAESQFKMIEDWLLKNECVTRVEFRKGYLRSSPPMKQVFITAVSDTLSLSRTINISLGTQSLKTENITVK